MSLAVNKCSEGKRKLLGEDAYHMALIDLPFVSILNIGFIGGY